MYSRRFAASLVVIALAHSGCGTPASHVVTVDAAGSAVEFTAVVNAEGFGIGEMAGYHLIVYADGGSAGAALLQADVSDVAVLDALESLGATPGDGLGMDTWDERHDESSWKPDRLITGPPVEILVRVAEGESLLTLDEILEDRAGVGFDMRLGGHRGNIAAWRSGCVACLYSCPGSKVGNARSTVRDFVEGLVPFHVKQGVLPSDGARVTVRLRLTDGSSGIAVASPAN